MDDPWDWDVDRVVQEFCTPNRSWKPNREPPALPPSDQLEALLREQETDGFTLLTYTDRDELHRELGIKKLNQKATFSNAIEQLRKRSLKYQRQQSGQDDPLESSFADQPTLDQAPVTPQAQSIMRTGTETKRKIIEGMMALTKNGQEVKTAGLMTSDNAVNQSPAAVPARLTDSVTTPIDMDDERPQKRRRVAPITVTTDVDVNTRRKIPTAADGILGASSNVASALITTSGSGSESVPVIDPSDAYLGMEAVTRIELTELDSPVTDEPLTQEDCTFQFIGNNRLPQGRQLQRYRLFKRHLVPRQTPARFIPTKPDTVFGANDPNRDEVLPVYGESESEYDSETWEEMEAENDERTAAGTASTGLSPDQVNVIIDEEIQKLVDYWKEHRLPKLSRSAYRVWSEPRKRGYLRIAIHQERQRVLDLERRVAKYRDEILEQRFYKEAEVRSQCRTFEQTVDEREAAAWKAGILSSSKEPEKPAHVPRAAPRKPRQARPVNDDGSEVLTSESEDEDLGDFIVDDDDHYEPQLLDSNGGGSPMSISDYYSPAVGSPVANGLRDGATEKKEFTGPASVQPNNSDVPSGSKDPLTPSKNQREQPTIIDLTTPVKGLVLNSSPATARERRGSFVKIKVPNPESGSKQPSSHPKKHIHKPPTDRDIDISDLPSQEHAVTEQLQKLSSNFKCIIFSVVTGMTTDEVWKDFILNSLHAPTFPQTPYTAEEKDIVVGFRLLRLFDVWMETVNYTWQQYKRLSEDDKKDIIEYVEKNADDFGFFIGFLRRISDRFEWHKTETLKKKGEGESSALVATKPQAAAEPTSDADEFGTADEDIYSEDADDTPSKKKKRRLKARNQEAKNLRETDRAQMHEQELRRDQLRARFAQLKAQGEELASVEAMIINETKEDHEGFVYVPSNIAPRIKEHQVAGVRFMWNQVVAKSGTRQGCLLAHTMGLGKTMQIITLLMTIGQAASSPDESVRSQIPDHLRKSRTLILCPPTLVNNWMDELLLWTPHDHNLGHFYKVDSQLSQLERFAGIREWADKGGVVIIGYQLLKKCMKDDEEIKRTLQEAPSLVVADEAHYMKNPNTQTYQATANFKTKSRIALTGSPLANNVEEYHSMIDWVAPNYLSNIAEFRADYANPIREGLDVGSTSQMRRIALARLHALKTTVGPKVHRLTISILKNDIPTKTEFVLVMPLTPIQKTAYENQITPTDDLSVPQRFAKLNMLGLICAHPVCYKMQLEQAIAEQENPGKYKAPKSTDDQEESDAPLPPQFLSDQLAFLRKTKNLDESSNSWKISMLTTILDEARNVGDSVLVFSHSITTLNYLEDRLRMQRRDVHRLDGKTPMQSRQGMVKGFNKSNSAPQVFLISTMAGGLGLNIVGANRVVLFDFKFNPQQEQQAVGRAYRLGQTKPVFVYRFVCGGTFEEHLLSRSIFKMHLSDRVVDKKNPIPKASHFNNLFKMPSEPKQEDLSVGRGRDTVMDRVIDSEELRAGLRSIILWDTFQEESIEDSKLSQAELQEAGNYIAKQQQRMGNKTIDPFPMAIPGYGAEVASSQHHTGPGPTPAATASANHTTHVATPSQLAQVTNGRTAIPGLDQHLQPTMGATNGRTEIPGLGQHLQPTMGASTGMRTGVELNESVFKSELKRLFNVDAISQAIVDAVESQEGQRPFETQKNAKWAIVEAAGNPRFVEALETGILSPQTLATLDAAMINSHRQQYDAVSEEQWRERIGNQSHGADPEVHNPSL